jgi:hypothetical protein
MNFTNYDYYKNNSSDNSFTYSIQEIHKKQKEKEKLRLKIYETISVRCFKKIKETSANEETFCFFEIPEYIPGLPLYNLTECVVFLLNILQDKGFKGRYIDKHILFISWHLPKPNLRLIDAPKIEQKNNNLIENLPLKYKPIENYSAFGNFLPKKKF